MKRITILADLTKYKLSLAVTMSAVTGYFISGSVIKFPFLLLLSGIFLLTSGAAALNQYTEKEFDATMKRTRNRPLPLQQIEPVIALWIAIILIVTGLSVLFITGIVPLILGSFAVILYNLVYTKLKRITLLFGHSRGTCGSNTSAYRLFLCWRNSSRE